MRRFRGMSAVEMMVGIAIIAVATGAVARAFSSGLDYQNLSEKARDRTDARIRFEDRMTRLIRGATLTGANTYLISPVESSDAGVTPPSTQTILAAGSASLMLTSLFDAPTVRYLTSTESDFQILNQTFGPQTGVAEIAFSTIPVGDAGIKQGLFMREQKPSDTDPKQGGTEFDFNPDVLDIRFEFYDGTQWQTAWDTTTDAQKGKLPTAVRVTYVLRGDQQPYSFLVRLMIASPPAPANPSNSSTTAGAPSSGAPSNGALSGANQSSSSSSTGGSPTSASTAGGTP
jgi:type II secretory pathway pseudopilin PulG